MSSSSSEEEEEEEEEEDTCWCFFGDAISYSAYTGLHGTFS